VTPLERAELELHRMLARLKNGEDISTAEIIRPLERFIEEKVQQRFEQARDSVNKWADEKLT
jgi:hypothetical protein